MLKQSRIHPTQVLYGGEQSALAIQAHIEDREDPMKSHPPAGDHLAIVSCMENSRDRVLLALFGDLASDICHSPV